VDNTDRELKTQALKTMSALERMADAITEHLTTLMPTPEEPDTEPGTAPDEVVIDGKLTVKGDLVVEGTTVTISSETQPGELDELSRVITKHHQALGLIATFAMMKDQPARGMDPARAVATLLGMQACRDCVGTGREDGRHPCSFCQGTGYTRA